MNEKSGFVEAFIVGLAFCVVIAGGFSLSATLEENNKKSNELIKAVDDYEVRRTYCSSSPDSPPGSEVATEAFKVLAITVKASELADRKDPSDYETCILSPYYAGERYEISYLDGEENTKTILVAKGLVNLQFSNDGAPSTLAINTVTFPKIEDEAFVTSSVAKILKPKKTDTTKMEYKTYVLNASAVSSLG